MTARMDTSQMHAVISEHEDEHRLARRAVYGGMEDDNLEFATARIMNHPMRARVRDRAQQKPIRKAIEKRRWPKNHRWTETEQERD